MTMLQEIFYWLFNMSITASVTGVMVLLIRMIKKIPRRLTVFLWVIPFFRMIFPLGMNSPYSLMSLLSYISTKTVVVYQPTENLIFSTMNSIAAADTYFPITYKINILEDIFSVASVIWVIVFLTLFLMLSVMYFITICEIKDSTHLKDNIYFSEKIMSPAVYGIIKPKIILPLSYKEKNIDFIILHEKTHIRSLDNLWRLIAFVIVAIHWFNPICWLLLKAFLTDIELSCDERVLAKLGGSCTKEYSLSLLENSQGKSLFASSFGGAKMRTRIENILSFKKISWFSLIVSISLISAVFYVLLTNAE